MCGRSLKLSCLNEWWGACYRCSTNIMYVTWLLSIPPFQLSSLNLPGGSCMNVKYLDWEIELLHLDLTFTNVAKRVNLPISYDNPHSKFHFSPASFKINVITIVGVTSEAAVSRSAARLIDRTINLISRKRIKNEL